MWKVHKQEIEEFAYISFLKNYYKRMYQLIILLRPWQWVKNLLIFIPLLLSSQNINDAFSGLISTFVIFSLFVSSTYIFHDIQDIDTDKLHQTKKNRPIAAGRIEVTSAKLISIIIF